MGLTLVIGGARSGKSRYAEAICRAHAPVVYLATARPDDAEMRRRIARHRAARPSQWTTIEEPIDVVAALSDASPPEATVLLDCATTWLSNLAAAQRHRPPDDLQAWLLAAVDELGAVARRRTTVIVSNELGAGIVPQTPVGRFFRDVHGLANQALAGHASQVVLMVAGLPLPLKGTPPHESGAHGPPR